MKTQINNQEYKNGKPVLVCKDCGYSDINTEFPNTPDEDNLSEPFCPMCNSTQVFAKRKEIPGKCPFCGSTDRYEEPGYYKNQTTLPDGRIDMGVWNPDTIICNNCDNREYW